MLALAMMAVFGVAQPADARIEDNSFLIEEAYNQAAGVVHHNAGLLIDRRTHDWAAVVTEEWPVASVHDQASVTVPWAHAAAYRATGFGDVALNYRHQFGGEEQDVYAFSPRMSLALPSGDYRRGLGLGAPGLQLMFPVSFKLGAHWVGHSNAGVTLTPGARDAAGNQASLTGLAAGQSLLWLLATRVNAMLEVLWKQTESVAGPGRVEKCTSLSLAPGIRWSHDFSSGLQIVPGAAVVFDSRLPVRDAGLFFYLSFEHPLWKMD